MMPKRIVLVVVFLSAFLANAASAQVKLITLGQLESRFKSGGDTVYVVNFWATWCAPCVAELPYFERLKTEHPGQPLKVVLVSLDFESKLKTDVIPFVKKNKLTSEVFLASKKKDQEFIDGVDKDWSGAIPATLVVNTKKRLRHFYEKEFTYPELKALYQTSK